MNRVTKTTSIIKPKTTLLINKILPSNDTINLEPITWGKLNEAVALKEYLITDATKHRYFKVNKRGLFRDHKNLILKHRLMQWLLANVLDFVL